MGYVKKDIWTPFQKRTKRSLRMPCNFLQFMQHFTAIRMNVMVLNNISDFCAIYGEDLSGNT